MQEKLSLRSKLPFGIGAFGKDMVYAIVSTFFMKYLTDYRRSTLFSLPFWLPPSRYFLRRRSGLLR